MLMSFLDRLEQSAQENSVKLIVVLTTNTPRKEIDSAIKSRCTYVEIKPLPAGECAKVAENALRKSVASNKKSHLNIERIARAIPACTDLRILTSAIDEAVRCAESSEECIKLIIQILEERNR